MPIASTASSRASWTQRRSARRHTVRATCSAAAAGVPPGSTNRASGASSPSNASIRRSSSSTSACLGSGSPLFARCAASGVASEPPSANSSDWIRGEELAQIALRGRGRRDAEGGVELVDRAVGLDAQRVLRDALSAEQIGLPTVAAAGVDLHRGSSSSVAVEQLVELALDLGIERARRRLAAMHAARRAAQEPDDESTTPGEHRDRHPVGGRADSLGLRRASGSSRRSARRAPPRGRRACGPPRPARGSTCAGSRRRATDSPRASARDRTGSSDRSPGRRPSSPVRLGRGSFGGGGPRTPRARIAPRTRSAQPRSSPDLRRARVTEDALGERRERAARPARSRPDPRRTGGPRRPRARARDRTGSARSPRRPSRRSARAGSASRNSATSAPHAPQTALAKFSTSPSTGTRASNARRSERSTASSATSVGIATASATTRSLRNGTQRGQPVSARREVDHEAVELAPRRASDQVGERGLLERAAPGRARAVGALPVERLIALEEEVHALHGEPARARDRAQAFVGADPHRLAAQPEHLRHRRAVQVGVEQADPAAGQAERCGQVHRHRALAHAALAAHHGDDPLDARERRVRARADLFDVLELEARARRTSAALTSRRAARRAARAVRRRGAC